MYVREFRFNLRAFMAACIGMGTGAALGHYTMSLFGPALIAEFDWSRADFALVGSLALVNLLTMPFAGWFIDRFGPRTSAMIGFIALVFGYLALAAMSGNILVFFAITAAHGVFGGLSATLVFCSLVVRNFERARGFALAMVMSVAPLLGMIATPLLGHFIDEHGWRAGYLVLAAVSAAGGLVAILLMRRKDTAADSALGKVTVTGPELRAYLRHPVLLLILAGTFLINLPQPFGSSQLKLIAMGRGMTSDAATWMVSFYASGVLVGRFVCGLALDRMAPHIVALFALGLPAIGYATFATPASSLLMLSGAVMLIGLAQGAEGDVGAYLLSRQFDVRNFSLLLSLLTATLGTGTALGAVVLSVSLRITDSYQPFLLFSSIVSAIGAMLFGLTGIRYWSRKRTTPST